jgi:hypothetical protein
MEYGEPMLSRAEVEEIAERGQKGWYWSYQDDIPALIASLREAMRALEQFAEEPTFAPLLSLWNQVPSEDTRPESIRDLPDDPGDGHNADPRFDDMHSGPSEEGK